MILVVDSALQLEQAAIKKLNLEVAEYPMFLNGEPYEVSMDMDRAAKDALRLCLKDKANVVTTAGLKEEDLIGIYKKYEGDQILSLHQAGKASTATQAVLKKILSEYKNYDIEYIDAHHLTAAYSVIVQLAGEAVKAGKNRDEVKELILRSRENTRHLGMVYDLFYLHRTGRIGLAKAIMGSAMKIHAILSSSDEPGILKSIGKVKNYHQANQRFIKLIQEDMELKQGKSLRGVISVIGPHDKEAQDLKELVENLDFPSHVEVHFTNHSNMPHAGPDFYDIGYTIEQE